MAALAQRLNGTASMKFTLKIVSDIARIKEVLNLPDTYAMWGADHFLTVDESDILNVDYLAKIEEGIRFPNAAERDAQMSLLNPMDPARDQPSQLRAASLRSGGAARGARRRQ